MTTTDKLPIRRVVLYRNGVGYFERGGHFEGRHLRFGVQKSEVGDFLSSLTVLDDQKGHVRSVSFELEKEKLRAHDREKTETETSGTETSQTEDKARLNVGLRFDGQEHDLRVSYVLGAPIWRPSYRLVLDEKGALLQAWAVVQNTSGEDWNDVRLSLTTGAPIAYRSDLGQAITPPRPLVTDTGEVVAAVPESETTLATDQPSKEEAEGRAADEAAPPESASGSGASVDRMIEAQKRLSRGVVTRAPARSARKPAEAADKDARLSVAPAPRPGVTANQAQQSVSAMAALAVLGAGVTRYDIDTPLTIPDGSSTMVAVLSRRIPGEDARLFAPDGAVSSSSMHPFRVARLENRTGAMLERGPIAVMGKDGFLGQGVLSPLHRDATAFVPFALDRSISVESSRSSNEGPALLVRVSKGEVTVERFSQYVTTYKVRNGGAEAVKLYVRHQRVGGTELHDPPAFTEFTPQHALSPVRVAAHGSSTLTLTERSPVQRTMDFMSDAAAEAVSLYLRGPAIDAAQGPALQKAIKIREDLQREQAAMDAAEAERQEHQANAEETRRNLEAIQKVKSAADLRARLVKRVGELDAKVAGLTKTIVERQTRLSELRVRLSEALQSVTLVVHDHNKDKH